MGDIAKRLREEAERRCRPGDEAASAFGLRVVGGDSKPRRRGGKKSAV